MKETAILINTARGGIVNETDLLSALESNQIAGAALDVLMCEPPRKEHPILSIASHDNVIITPHMAWGSKAAIQTLADQLIRNIDAFLDGKPKNLVK